MSKIFFLNFLGMRNFSIHIDKPVQEKKDNTSMFSKYNKIKNSSSIINTETNILSTNNSTVNSFKQYKENIKSSKKNPKQISLNITSIQSPEQEAVYFNEEKDSTELKNKTDLPTNKHINNLFKLNNNSIKINFLIELFGQEKVNKLINLIENSTNPIILLTNDGKEIESIVGDKFKVAQNFLKCLIVNNK